MMSIKSKEDTNGVEKTVEIFLFPTAGFSAKCLNDCLNFLYIDLFHFFVSLIKTKLIWCICIS